MRTKRCPKSTIHGLLVRKIRGESPVCLDSDNWFFPCYQSSLRAFVWQSVGIPMHAPARAPWVRPARLPPAVRRGPFSVRVSSVRRPLNLIDRWAV